jgi:hypothetical protein
MPGGKRKLKQLFTSRMQMGAEGTEIAKIMSGSVGFATAGCAATAVHNACSVAEVTIANLSPCAMIVGTVQGMSACFRFQGEVIAGDGQASVVYRYAGCGASVDPRTGTTGGTLRYIAFDPA